MELCQCDEPGCVKAREDYKKEKEELYQEFKKRLVNELRVEIPVSGNTMACHYLKSI